MTGAAVSAPFDVAGPLPAGITVLEASAGTGKTYTIAALAARYVALGTPLDRLLLVTFTRMATGELRERVRERLLGVHRGLERTLAGGGVAGEDPITDLLAQAPEAEVAASRDRLRRALAEFDAATIATTHGFCQEVLGGLGVAGDLERDYTFVEEVDDLVREVIDDLYTRFHGREERPPFDRSEAAEIARKAVENPTTEIVPASTTTGERRRNLALAVREELERRKRRLGVMTYDDLLTRLDSALAGEGGSATSDRLRARFDVVLVDEFQDTDPVQWSILRRAFGDGDTTLVLIGDPKQAIYAFRGADVYAYLEARKSAGERATLDVNRRSDQGLIDAYDALFGGAKLGHEGIAYRRVRAAEENQAPRLSGAPEPAPLRVRVLHRDEPTVTPTKTAGYANVGSARKHVAEDVAADIAALLSSEATIECRTGDGGVSRREGVRPGHVGVLVPTNRNAALVRDALSAAGIPAVINGAGSVFGTPEAGEWLRLLEAIERPSSPPRARSAALTCFLGWSAERVATAGERDWEEVHQHLHDWARVLRVRGVASLTEAITAAERLPERILATAGGERRLTDLRHVAQLLHAAGTSEGMEAAALTSWLRQRIAEAEQDTTDEERSRRLESDAEAVQVLTIHRSKGLEFPIVYVPFLWERGYYEKGAHPVFFHDPDHDDARALDVSFEGSSYGRNARQGIVERRGEDLRLAYVALTRARHQAVVWWAATWKGEDAALNRLLFDRDEDGNVPAEGDRVPGDAEAVARFEALVDEAPGCVSVERSVLGPPRRYAATPVAPGELVAETFGRGIDWRWRRTSYSDITAGRAWEPGASSEPEEASVIDEPELAVGSGSGVVSADSAGTTAVPCPLAKMPVGLAVGTIVHRVLEETDFAGADLDAELSEQLAVARGRRSVELGDPATVVGGLRAAIETPLGGLVGGVRLRDVRLEDRIDELEFELPLAGGDDPTGEVTLAAIARVLGDELPAGDPLAGYAERLRDPALRRAVGGYLTGSLDVVVRVGGNGDGGQPRFAVVDYKTNWLAPPDEELTTWHHRPEALAAEMRRGHYGLQALLYSVAVHRYLRWRLPGYDVERDFAGVLYLFLRGMVGPETPTVGGTPCGVFAWRPPGALVEALSDVLDGEVVAR